MSVCFSIQLSVFLSLYANNTKGDCGESRLRWTRHTSLCEYGKFTFTKVCLKTGLNIRRLNDNLGLIEQVCEEGAAEYCKNNKMCTRRKVKKGMLSSAVPYRVSARKLQDLSMLIRCGEKKRRCLKTVLQWKVRDYNELFLLHFLFNNVTIHRFFLSIQIISDNFFSFHDR